MRFSCASRRVSAQLEPASSGLAVNGLGILSLSLSAKRIWQKLSANRIVRKLEPDSPDFQDHVKKEIPRINVTFLLACQKTI
jgi:hypothetical protein